MIQLINFSGQHTQMNEVKASSIANPEALDE